ncbi:uncharacterized protein LOC125561994 isoform X2 [Nematostella vectensis]|uniref:uncharacterized protein LOC125561994 isoform X2 n=1 Tax=Nematostella vectensis TaxID=45351 RepID=UPI002076FFBB|nr:uncharacterized protein LOC125561994 isoform X2 [Nematostella vectensis]
MLMDASLSAGYECFHSGRSNSDNECGVKETNQSVKHLQHGWSSRTCRGWEQRRNLYSQIVFFDFEGKKPLVAGRLAEESRDLTSLRCEQISFFLIMLW